MTQTHFTRLLLALVILSLIVACSWSTAPRRTCWKYTAMREIVQPLVATHPVTGERIVIGEYRQEVPTDSVRVACPGAEWWRG